MIRTVCAVLAACAFLITGCAAASTAGPTGQAPTPPSVAAAALPRPDHVVIVVLENKDQPDVARDAAYLRSLGNAGAELTDMHAETHPSQPNYLTLFSGDLHGVTDNSCPHTFDAPNLASELTDAGFSFAGYSEDLPNPGHPGCQAGNYARKHSPWTNFTTVPSSANQPLTAMSTDYAALPTVSFLIPNLCHDMHDCSIAEGDTWLQQNIDSYAQWARTHNSLLIVTFDESGSSQDVDNHIATLAVGQMVKSGTYTERVDHYRLLRTLEDMYGLTPLGHSTATPALTSIWQPA
jgi:phosphatidylinositol-3-phosphatase